MAAGAHTWQIKSLQSSRDTCIQSPSFKVGSLLFQLQLHTPASFNGWPEPGALFLRVTSDVSEKLPAEKLRIHAAFTLPQLDFSGGIAAKDTFVRWQGGLGPSPEESEKLIQALKDFTGVRLTVEIVVNILDIECVNLTLLRWPLGDFWDLRSSHAATPCGGGFHKRLSRRFEVHGPEIGQLCFRADLHPNIDATGNLFVSFVLESADTKFQQLEVLYTIALDEVDFISKSRPLRGSREQWTKELGLAGRPTDCPILRHYQGPLTLQLSLSARLIELAVPSELQVPVHISASEGSISDVCSDSPHRMDSTLDLRNLSPDSALRRRPSFLEAP